MALSRVWIKVLIIAAVLASESGHATAQNRAPATRDEAVLSVDGVVREIFQSVRQDRVDYIVQIEVKRSEALRAARTSVRVPVPAPGDMVYVHTSQRQDRALGLGQTSRGEPRDSASGSPQLPAERAQVRAYLCPKSSGEWEGAGGDWFELTSRDLAAAGPSDPPPPVAETAPGSLRPRPMPGANEPREARSALTTLGLTGEPKTVQGQFVVRVTSIEPGSPAQSAGLEPGDIIIGANDKALAGIDQLDQLTQQGGRMTLVVLDVNNGKTARVRVELPAAVRRTTPGGLPPLADRPETTDTPKDAPISIPQPRGRSLGVSAEPVTIGQRTGMKVIGVHPDSPAQKAGIEPGDVIVAANGVAITGAEVLSAVVHKSGASLSLTVRNTRNGKDTRVDVNLGGEEPGNLTPAPTDAASPPASGRRLGAVTELVFHDVDPAVKVTEVEPGSPAANAGIEPGDVIVEANGTPVLHPKTLEEIVRKSGQNLKLMVIDPRTQKKTPVDVTLGAIR